VPTAPETAAEAAQYFFLSYARRQGVDPNEQSRRDPLVRRFHHDLEEQVRTLANRAQTVAAIDSEFPVGDRWPERVARGLARCRVFVALYSDDYFSSEHCGREWQAFVSRLGAGRRHAAVVPVLWQPCPRSSRGCAAGRSHRDPHTSDTA
jgi:hypothetical protein